MFRGQKSLNALSILKLKWPTGGESSIHDRLLNDVPPEIQLSDYQRLSSSGSESPSGLLHGETLKPDPIADLDLFFERLYNYYCEKGLWCIITKWIVELLCLAFTISFSGFMLLFVDWRGLLNMKCGIDAVESGMKPCDLAREALHKHPLVPFTFFKGIVLVYLGLFTIYWIFCFLRFFTQLKETLKIRDFYYNNLSVTDNEFQTTPWPVILEKVIQLQSSQPLCVVKDLSAHDVIMRIMRKENYLIAMINKGVLALPIPKWLPGAGPAVNSGQSGGKNHLILTTSLEWTLKWCILQSMFDRNFSIRRDFISNPSLLKKRLMAVGLGMLLMSPFLVIFVLVYFFLRHAEQFYNHPSMASSRKWSNLSKWMFREYNEVDHLFKQRINASVVHAADYLKQFPSPILSLIAKFVAYVASGFTATFIFIALLDESLLEAHIYGRNLVWYFAVFGAVTAISRAAVTNDHQVHDPEGAMSLVVQHTHYMPKKWRGKENTDCVRVEFEALFQYTLMMLLEEMISIFLTPCLLFFFVPKVSYQPMLDMLCFSIFDFESHGNIKYGSPCNASQEKRSSQGKMEKSVLSFKACYSSWEPDSLAKRFVLTMQDFGLHMQNQESYPNYSPTRAWQNNRNLGGPNDAHSFHFRDGLHRWGLSRPSAPFPWVQRHSPWLVNINHPSHPYLLDCYYLERGSCRVDVEMGLATPLDGHHEHKGHYWTDIDHEAQNQGRWGAFADDQQRSHLQASTSSTVFRDGLIQHHDVGHLGRTTESHWWARTGARSNAVQNSFMEPPSFGVHNFNHSRRSFSDGRVEEYDGNLNLRNSGNLFRNLADDDHDRDGAFSLPFGDIYTRTPQTILEQSGSDELS
ncbi:Autophagy-related protein 9 [Nymphaea thermarum]|nr:Autophagy-related protein 9 [Nymphaea thermarum]